MVPDGGGGGGGGINVSPCKPLSELCVSKMFLEFCSKFNFFHISFVKMSFLIIKIFSMTSPPNVSRITAKMTDKTPKMADFHYLIDTVV